MTTPSSPRRRARGRRWARGRKRLEVRLASRTGRTRGDRVVRRPQPGPAPVLPGVLRLTRPLPSRHPGLIQAPRSSGPSRRRSARVRVTPARPERWPARARSTPPGAGAARSRVQPPGPRRRRLRVAEHHDRLEAPASRGRRPSPRDPDRETEQGGQVDGGRGVGAAVEVAYGRPRRRRCARSGRGGEGHAASGPRGSVTCQYSRLFEVVSVDSASDSSAGFDAADQHRTDPVAAAESPRPRSAGRAPRPRAGDRDPAEVLGHQAADGVDVVVLDVDPNSSSRSSIG